MLIYAAQAVKKLIHASPDIGLHSTTVRRFYLDQFVMKNIWIILLLISNICPAQEATLKPYSQAASEVLDEFDMDGLFLKSTKIPDRIYAGGWKYYDGETGVQYNLAQNPKKMAIDLTKMNVKKGVYQAVASFNRHDFPTSFCYSRDAKYAIAVSGVSDELYLNSMDMASRKQIWKNVQIPIDGSISIESVAASNDAKQVAIWSQDGLWIVDTESKTSKKVATKEVQDRLTHDVPKMLWSTSSPQIVFTRKLKKSTTGGAPLLAVYDYERQEILYSIYDYIPNADDEPYSLYEDIYKSYSFFVDTEGNVTDQNSNTAISVNEGIGVVISPFSCVIFDQEGNNYSVKVKEAQRSLSDMVQVNGQPLIENYDPIPIVEDRLTPKAQAELLIKLSSLALEVNNNSLVQEVIETMHPYSIELTNMLVSKSSDSKEFQIINTILANQVVIEVNETDISMLSAQGLDQNKQKQQLIEMHAKAGGVSQEEIDAAKEKIKPLAAEYYYKSYDELILDGNKMMALGAKMSQKAALGGMVYFDAAAQKEPTRPEAFQGMGMAYMLGGQYEKALESYNKCLATSPDYPLALYGIVRANYYAVLGGAMEINENVVAAVQKNADRFLEIAPEKYQSEITATKEIRELIAMWLNDREMHDAYVDDQNMSLKTLSELADKMEGSYPYVAAVCANRIGLAIVDNVEHSGGGEQHYSMAKSYLIKATKGGIHESRTFYELARIDIEYFEDFVAGQATINESKKYVQNDPYIAKLENYIPYAQGHNLYNEGKNAESIRMLEKHKANAAPGMVTFRTYYMLAFMYYDSKQYAKAAENFEMIKTDEQKRDALYAYYPTFDEVLAYCKSPSGSPPKLVNNEQLIHDTEDKYDEGSALLDDGKIDEAIEVMKSASDTFLELDFKYGIAVTNSGLGVAYCQKKEFDTAIPYLEKCIEAGAQSSSCYNNLAWAKHFAGQFGVFDIIREGQKKFPDAQDLKKTYKTLMDD